jgi:hypothetical protein
MRSCLLQDKVNRFYPYVPQLFCESFLFSSIKNKHKYLFIKDLITNANDKYFLGNTVETCAMLTTGRNREYK